MWMEWSGWNFVSAVLTAVGLVALGLAFGDVLRRRRRIVPVELVIDNIGRAMFNDEPVEVFEITNNGSEELRILTWGFVLADPRVTLDYRVPRRLSPGGSARFTVVSGDLSKAWMLLVWRSLDDKRWFRVQWLPLLASAAWTASIQEQRNRVPKRPWWHIWPLRLPIQPVSPSTIELAEVRIDRKHRNRMNVKLGQAVSAVRLHGGDLYTHGRIIEVTEQIGETAEATSAGSN